MNGMFDPMLRIPCITDPRVDSSVKLMINSSNGLLAVAALLTPGHKAWWEKRIFPHRLAKMLENICQRKMTTTVFTFKDLKTRTTCFLMLTDE